MLQALDCAQESSGTLSRADYNSESATVIMTVKAAPNQEACSSHGFCSALLGVRKWTGRSQAAGFCSMTPQAAAGRLSLGAGAIGRLILCHVWRQALAAGGGPRPFPAPASPCCLLTERVWASSKHGGLEGGFQAQVLGERQVELHSFHDPASEGRFKGRGVTLTSCVSFLRLL